MVTYTINAEDNSFKTYYYGEDDEPVLLREKDNLIGYCVPIGNLNKLDSQACKIAYQIYNNKYEHNIRCKHELEFWVQFATKNTFTQNCYVSDELIHELYMFEYSGYIRKNVERIQAASYYILFNLNNKTEMEAIDYTSTLTMNIINLLNGQMNSFDIRNIGNFLIRTGDTVDYLRQVYGVSTKKLLSKIEIIRAISSNRNNESRMKEILQDIEERINTNRLRDFIPTQKQCHAALFLVIYEHCNLVKSELGFKSFKEYLCQYYKYENSNFKISQIKSVALKLYESNSVYWRSVLKKN